VFHQPTDFFTSGRFTTPTKVIIETAVSADFIEAKVDFMPMIAKYTKKSTTVAVSQASHT